jgi:protoporphyrinogen/coproporphyrinogen III oxidase
MISDKKIAVLGAGISGLATAYLLDKAGLDITIFESGSEPGGTMQTVNDNGFLIDYGPNSGLETTPLISRLVGEIGLSNEMVYAAENSSKRYILRENRLRALPMNILGFVKSDLFSVKGKLRLLAEPIIGKSEDGYYQSIAEFVTRRLGREFLDYAIDPFVSGVFAGDPERLSVKSAFPKLYRLEEIYGGLIKGMIKGASERKTAAEKSKQNARMFSFISGMQIFPKSIARMLNGKIEYNSAVVKVESLDSGYNILYKQNGEIHNFRTDLVLSTLPAYASSEVFRDLDGNLASHFQSIYYPPVLVLFLGFRKESIGQPLDGFGYLIPSRENKTYLGAIWSSAIFPNRCPDEHVAFTLFTGGARSPGLFETDKQKVIDTVLSEFMETMKIKEAPMIIKEKFWPKAIPQYNTGYIEHENYFHKFEREKKGIYLGGNYRGGISVGDCIKNSELISGRILNELQAAD